jgi:hypothetical protein
MRYVLTVLMIVPALGGCGLVAANRDLRASEADYKACLVANPAAPENCQGLRLAMETDAQRLDRMTGRPEPRATLTVQSR